MKYIIEKYFSKHPDVSGEIIYHECFEDNFKGMFDDDIERQKYLSEISNVISNKICGKEVNTEYEIFTDFGDLRKRLNNESSFFNNGFNA